MDIFEKDNRFIAHTYGRAPIAILRGAGSLVYDESDKPYIDLGSGIAVNIFGVGDEVWKEAVRRQMDCVQHASNLYYTAPQAELAELLAQKTGMRKVFFANSGAEANECMIKAARKYSYDKYGEGRHVIVTLKNSFHGRTITTLSASGQDSLHTHFMPFTPGFAYVQANDIQELEALLQNGDVCAVMLELIQGEGGVIPLDKAYVKQVEALAKERDILLLIDEVQTGNGRTGHFYAYMQYGIAPDIVSTAKGLGGGLPIGACMFFEKTQDVLSPGMHGSTFGGNPLAAAGAVSIVKRIDETLLAEVREKSAYIFRELSGAKGVKNVTGMGLMIGILAHRDAKEVLQACRERGVIVLTAHERVRLLPALNIPMGQLKQAIAVLKEVLSQ